MTDIKNIVDDSFINNFIKNSTEQIKNEIIQQIKNNNLNNLKICCLCKKSNLETEFSKYKKYCSTCFKHKQHLYYTKWKKDGYQYTPTGNLKGRPKKNKSINV
jgi:hypothetical protein